MAQRTRASLKKAELNSAVNSDAAAAKTRRHHKKSRNGCAECKHRHIRCDERQPSCVNCEAAERTCSFLTQHAENEGQPRGHQHHAKQQRRPEATGSLVTGLKAHGNTDAQPLHSTVREQTEQPSPFAHQNFNNLHLSHTTEQVSRRSESSPFRYSLPPITGLEVQSHQIPSPAPPVQLGEVHTPPSDCCPGLLTIPDIVPKALFTPQHLILLHHAASVPNFTGSNSRNVVDIAIRHIIDAPYLIDEVLAFTAFHLAGIYSGSAPHLRRLATELQTRALASFTQLTEAVPADDKATAVPRFLFSGILGRHALADALLHCQPDFHFFIDRFVECINLNRGIRAVAPPAWDHLYNSEMRPFISVVREAQDKIVSPGNECDTLSCLMDNSDLNEVSTEACRHAIGVLQWSFDVCRNLSEDDYPAAASAFSVRIGADFVDVLRKHRPEALVILAYYGVLLSRCRSLWAFENAGGSLIRAIAGQLGTYWQEALVWPLHMLEGDLHSEPLTLIPGNNVLEMPSRMQK